MYDVFDQLHEDIYTYRAITYQTPIKIKVSIDFANRLIAECPVMLTYDTLSGYTNSIAGIPIEIDDTIENEYEFVYEEKKNK